MNSKAVNIVWLKRDLRSQDHAPLLKAEFNHSNNLFFNLDSPIIVFSDNPSANKEYAEGAIIANPLLVNLFKGDYRPTANSPSVDNGYDDGHYSFDLDGNSIISKRDIGAYEFQGK